MTTRGELKRILKSEVLDIHGVARLLGVSRSSVNVLLVRPSSEFPEPIYTSKGEGSARQHVRLWWREDIEIWLRNKPSNRMNGGAR